MMSVGVVPDVSVFSKLMDNAWLEHPELKDTGLKVLARDRFVCQVCGFRSRPASSSGVPHGWMIPASLRHPGFLPVKEEISKTFCPFCISSFAINWSVAPQAATGRDDLSPGMLVSLSGLSQVQTNRLATCVISTLASVAISGSRTSVEASAMAINNAMKGRQALLESELPVYRTGLDDSFAKALALLPEDLYSRRSEIVGTVRWWPNLEYWEEQGNFWRRASYQF